MTLEFIDKKFDFPPTQTKKSLIVCSTPRSGSNMLCFSLAQTGLVGVPLEYLNRSEAILRLQHRLGDTVIMSDYIKSLLQHRTSPNGIFGIKMHFHQLKEILRMVPPHSIFPDSHYVFIYRKDRILQAISLFIAYKTKQWYFTQLNQPLKEVEYSFEWIFEQLKNILVDQRGWSQFFAHYKQKPLVLCYEDMVKDFPKAIRNIYDTLQIEYDAENIPKIPYTKSQTSQRNQIWKKRFMSDLMDRKF